MNKATKISSCFLFVVIAAATAHAESFLAYCPSPKTQTLHVFQGLEENGEFSLTETSVVNLGFSGRIIVQHGEKPILYVSAANGRDGQVAAATIYLNAEGSVTRVVKTRLAHGHCHLNLDRTRKFLLGVEYKGRVSVYALKADGSIGEAVHQLNEGRTQAHCVFPSPDNRFVYIPYVKQSNAVYQYAFDEKAGKLTPLEKKDAGPPPDTGPRHQQYHKTLPITYFSNEQGLGVSAYDMAANGQLSIRQIVAIDGTPPAEGISASDLVISPDGRFLFSGVRDSKGDYNWIARYRVKANGDLEHLGLTPADQVPWGLAVSPTGRYLVVTASKGNSLTAYKIGPSGALTKRASATLPTAVADVVVLSSNSVTTATLTRATPQTN